VPLAIAFSAGEVILAILAVLAALAYYIFVYSKRRLLLRMLAAVHMVKVGIFARLTLRYRAEHGEAKAEMLAAAVVNDLFALPPSGPDGERFQREERDLIQRELRNLRGLEDILDTAAQALRVQETVYQARHERSLQESVDALAKLQDLGTDVPDRALPPAVFVSFARGFFKAATSTTSPTDRA